jgi:hypothetical protein
MDWNAVSAVAGVFAAIFVAITVVYLAPHSQTYQLATPALAEMAGIIGSDKGLARIFCIGMVEPDVLTEDEFRRLKASVGLL